jgi:HSP20 family protein
MTSMDPQDEAFFTQLAGSKEEADGTYEVELAKARTSAGGVLTTAAAAAAPGIKPKMLKTKEEAEAEMAAEDEAMWDDGEPEGKLTVDVYQTPNDIVVESAIAGVRAEDIDVHATTDSITIRGARKREKAVKDEDYLYQECYWGRFARTIILPQEVDPDAASVSFKNGILTVKLPKANRKKTKKLKVVVE